MRTFTATWTDLSGTTYEQKMELADGDVTADLAHHHAWVEEMHDVATYRVEETTPSSTEAELARTLAYLARHGITY